MIRLFAAIAVPPEIGAGLQRRQTGLEGARWRPLSAFHITLRFFGELREDLAEDLDGQLQSIAQPAFDLSLSGAGVFGEGDTVDAVWAGVEESAPLRRLAARCETSALQAGLSPEGRRYLPHVTLAYLKHSAPDAVARWVQANNLLRSPPFRIERFGLYSSWRTREGSVYQLEREYRLF